MASGIAACGVKRHKMRRIACRVASATWPSPAGLMIKPDECQELVSQSRPAHWVIRTSELQDTLNFLSKVFGMRVLRHEEFDKPCAITCNGTYATPWSKTMVGYGPEDECYCLELTYNYGISSYEVSPGLAHIAIGVDSIDVTLTAAASMGYSVDHDIIKGPDGYRFRATLQQPGRKERFQYIALRVADVPKSVEFYQQALGMKALPANSDHVASAGSSAEQVRVLGYSPEQVPLVLFQGEDVLGVSAEQREGRAWEGRNAMAVPGRALRAIYKRILESGYGGGILHPVREFNELPALRRMRGLPPMPCEPPPEEALRALRENPASAPPDGTLAVAVVTDADGYEICLVSAETYNMAVARAYNPGCEIDWAWREDAKAGKRTPTPQHMLACV